MKKQRRNYSAQEKVAILKRHVVEKVPISELCEQLGLQPTVFCRRQKKFFENGAAAFQPKNRRRPARVSSPGWTSRQANSTTGVNATARSTNTTLGPPASAGWSSGKSRRSSTFIASIRSKATAA